jgi:hypothetical protein
MHMTEHAEQYIPESFITDVKDNAVLWGLQFEDEWVVCDSQDETADVLPVWSSENAAKLLCCDEWAEYQPTAIPLDEFFEEWVNDLNEDGVLIGVEWDETLTGVEMDVLDFALAMSHVE